MGSYVALGVGVLVAVLLIPLLILAFLELCLWKIYLKLGYPGWAAIVPGYNLWIVADDFFGPWMAGAVVGCIFGGVMMAMSGNILLFLVGSIASLVGSILWAIVWYHVVRELGHGVGFFIGCLFLGIIFYPILAFYR